MTSVPSYITRSRHGIFYFQYRIPSRLIIAGADKKLFRKSLHTRERQYAIKLARRWAVWMDDLALRFFKDPKAFGKAMELLMTLKNQQNHWDSVEEFLMGLDKREEALLEDAISYNRLRDESQNQLIIQNDTLRKTIEVLHGRESPTPSSQQPNPNAPFLSDLVEFYIKDISIGWDEKHFEGNERDLRPRLETIVEIIGNKRCDTITREDIFRLKEIIVKLPSNRKKKAAYRDKTIEQLMEIDIPQSDLLSPSSANKNIEKASSFFKWCKANSTYVTEELWHPLVRRIKNDIPDDEQRDEFTIEDLKKLFLSTKYINGTHEKASHYWIPLLGLFTGARQNELCQLYKEDVYIEEESGIWVIDINDRAPDKKLKNKSHRRLVPIHPVLLDLGFIQFVQSSNDQRLFMDLIKNRDGYQDAFSKWFNRTYRSQKNCDVGNGKDEKKNFHSFRHTLINYLEKKHVPQPQVARLVGQQPSDGSVTTIRYGKKNSIQENMLIINNIDYTIDFTLIKPWQNRA